MRTLPLLLVTLAACGGGARSKTLGNFATGEPAGEPPTVTWSGGLPADGGTFKLTGFPAVADDGNAVLVGWMQGDGGRGYPNLTLVTLDRKDATVERRVVLDVDAVDGMTTALDVGADNAYLAASNTRARWRPLMAAEVKDVASGDPCGEGMFATAWTASAGDVTIALDDEAHLTIEVAGKQVVARTMTDWLVKDRPMYEGAAADEVCSNPLFLGSAFIDARRHLALLEAAYHGNDTCWEPTSTFHVVSW